MEPYEEGKEQDLPWESAAWYAEIEAWVQGALASEGIQTYGPISFLHKRPWSAFASIHTSKGTIYLKAPAPSLHFEAGLTQALAAIRPEYIAPLISIQPEQGWMLSMDSGEMLRHQINHVDDLHHWHCVLPMYAAFQRETAGHLSRLLATGAPDRRLAHFPRLYEELLNDTTNLRVDHPPGLSSEEHRQLCKLVPTVSTWCQQLANLGLPETICHEDFHDANVLLQNGRYRFVDWGDSSIGHPFFTMLVTIRSTAYRLGLEEFSAEMVRLLDVYLEAWTDLRPIRELKEAYEIAYKLAMINRSLSYHLNLGPLPERYKIENDGIPGWLQDFLEVSA